MKIKKVLAVGIFFTLLLSVVSAFPENVKVIEAESSSVVLLLGNGNAFANEKLMPISDLDKTVAPFKEDNVVYIPISLLKSAYDSKIDFKKTDSNITFEFSNKKFEINFSEKKINVGDSKISLDGKVILKNNEVYLQAKDYSKILNSNIKDYSNGLISIYKDKDAVADKNTADGYLKSFGGLSVVGNKDQLFKIAKNNSVVMTEDSEYVESNLPTLSAKESGDSSQPSEGSPYSQTNIQVEGVDEADIIKTDGEYIYLISNGKLYIVNAKNPSKLVLTKKLDETYEEMTKKGFKNQSFYPIEMFLDKDKLTLIGTFTKETEIVNYEKEVDSKIAMPYYGDYKTKVITYDIRNKEDIKEIRSYFIDGSYQTARKIDNIVYLVTNNYIYDGKVPIYFDSTLSSERELELDKMYCFPDYNSTSITNVSSIDVGDKTKKANVQSFLTNSNVVYVSPNNIYFVSSNYFDNTEKSDVYKIAINNGELAVSGKTEIDGTPLNQFSLDEYKGNFRIATTKSFYEKDTYSTKNYLFVLDENMKVVGKLDNLAKDESIKSARFMGDKIYIVTFKQVDPLFVIDASTATNPRVLGELKIPGYSTYLHPIDENHLLGIGYDTKVIKANGTEIVRNDGMKMAIFDVKDFYNPKELFVEKIGGEGTFSEVLFNHKALLYDKDKKIIAFPVSIVEKEESSIYDTIKTFNGAVVYNFDLEKGFSLRGKIVTDRDEYGNFQMVSRIIFIKDTLFATSYNEIVSTSLSDMKKIGSLLLENN